jgi:hypothetical protein
MRSRRHREGRRGQFRWDLKDHSDPRSYRALPCPGRIHPAVRIEQAVDGDSAYAAPEFATTSQPYQSLNQCSGASGPAPSSNPVMTSRAFDGCAKEYVECSLSAHIGPALRPNWAQDTWDFFASFRKTDRDVSHYRTTVNLAMGRRDSTLICRERPQRLKTFHAENPCDGVPTQ